MTADTVWTPWLATSLGAMYEHTKSQRGPDGGALLAPRAFNTANPLLNGDWANGSTFRMDRSAGKKHAYRANAVITNELGVKSGVDNFQVTDLIDGATYQWAPHTYVRLDPTRLSGKVVHIAQVKL